MISFSPLMYPDDVVFFRSVPATGGQGASRRTFPFPGIPYAASVQSRTVDRTDTQGRSVGVTVHTVRTTEDTGAKADDKFEWKGRVLVVEGKPVPGGIGDVIWIAQCLETL